MLVKIFIMDIQVCLIFLQTHLITMLMLQAPLMASQLQVTRLTIKVYGRRTRYRQ